MIKTYCDLCKQEIETIKVNIPTLNERGIKAANKNEQIYYGSHIEEQEFDLCRECYISFANEMGRRLGLFDKKE